MYEAFSPERLAGSLSRVRERLARACEKAGRPVDSVLLVAVTKNRPPEAVDALFSLGVRDVGENRVQEALAKAPSVSAPVTWHMIGHLQRNKAAKAISLFSSLHSADSIEMLRSLDRRLAGGEADSGSGPFPVHVQVNVSGEGTKSGIAASEVPSFLEAVTGLPRIRVVGLMTMPPWSEDPEAARPHFRALRELAGCVSKQGLLPDPPQLSMGMSGDFEVAVEEGATSVRIGSILFE
jgi:pyridoxal phosphate enzyme (YggS family)